MSQSMPGLPKKRDVSAHIRISMFDNRVEIVSPGGLPRGVTTEDYLSGNLSILRNPVLASVFFRLGIIEQFGTGIRRIKESYVRTGTRPRFEIAGGSITVILPVTDAEPLLDVDEKAIMSLLLPGRLLSRSQITDACGFGRDKEDAKPTKKFSSVFRRLRRFCVGWKAAPVALSYDALKL